MEASYFELEDAPGYLDAFPVLADKEVIGKGEFSVVYDGTRPDTVLKLTCDAAYVQFIKQSAGRPGLPAFVRQIGTMKCRDHGSIYLIEIPRLHVVLDETMMLERDAVIAAITYSVAKSERFNGIVPCQECHAGALQELSMCGVFSYAIRQALAAIARFMRKTKHDVLVDLRNPDNFMTDGKSLIITDPLLMVN